MVSFKLLISFSLLLFASNIWAQAPLATKLAASTTAAPETSLTQLALLENQQVKGEPLPTSTDAQVSGVLQLEDPKLSVVTRPWKYTLAFKVQNFQARGSATNDLGETFNLSERDEQVMPSLELGALWPWYKGSHVELYSLGTLQAGYTNQKSSVALKSGFRIEDAYLNSGIAMAGLGFGIRPMSLPSLRAEVSYRTGQLNYTQASSNDFAHFSASAPVAAINALAAVSVSERASILIEHSRRSLGSSSQEIGVEESNWELGTRLTW